MASNGERIGMNPSCGHLQIKGCTALENLAAISPRTHLPRGSNSASGRRLHNLSGGLAGLWMNVKCAAFHSAGKRNGVVPHHSCSFGNKKSASIIALLRQQMPGMQCFATDLVTGILAISFTNSSYEKGTPGISCGSSRTGCPCCQISLIYSVVMSIASSGDAGGPSGSLSLIFFLGCFGVYFSTA